MWDLDLSSGNCKSSYYTDYYVDGDSAKGFRCRNQEYYKRLFRNAEFVALVKKRYYDLQFQIQNLYRNDSTAVNSINNLIETYGNSFARNYMSKDLKGAGWRVNQDDGYSYAAESGWQTWMDPINFLRDWLERRNNWICQEWDIDMDQAYEDSREWSENPTTAAPTTARPSTEAPTTKAPTTKAPTTKAPTIKSTDVPTVAPTTEPPVEPTVVPTGETPVEQTVAPTDEPTKDQTVNPTDKKPTVKPSGGTKYSNVPGTATVIKAKKSAKKIKVTLKKLNRVSGYQIAVYKSKKNAKKNKKAIVKRYTITLNTKIKSKKFAKIKKLYVRARAYAIITGKVYFGRWSAIKKAK
jgi:hypothetical protein